ncbi:hypothetical protein MXD58_024255, partial [Frankia sp. AgKG'84/4]|nr:hypothetical protein [Frankia sp. AgKG'84/4]
RRPADSAASAVDGSAPRSQGWPDPRQPRGRADGAVPRGHGDGGERLAAGPGRGPAGPIGAGGTGVPNISHRGADPRAARSERPAGADDGLSAEAASIDQEQVDEVTRAWLERRGSVLDGIDVI